MKNLYAIRNIETGEIYRHTFVPIHATREGAEIDIREELNSEKYEPVTLRIEPTKPCHECDFHKRMFNFFCGNCGRSLT